MNTSTIYLGSFAITTLIMTFLLHALSEQGLAWRDSVIIGAVFGSVVPFMLWRWREDRRANRHFWNALKLVFGIGRR